MKYLSIISTFVLLFSQGCNEESLCLTGSGPVNEYELTMPDFEHVSLLGPINLRIKQGAKTTVMVEAESDIFSYMSYETKNETLKIGFKDNIRCFETDYGVWVNVTVPDLKSIYSSGISDIISDGDINFAQLELNISGTANIELTGKVAKQTIRTSGSVKVENFQLLTELTEIDISGSGDLEVSCSSELNIDVDGAATIAYIGSPSISQRSSGTLNLINAN